MGVSLLAQLEPLPLHQVEAIRTAERFSSVLSLLGSTIIITTFLSSHLLRKPVNRLIFYSAFTNICGNIGTVISVRGIAGGKNSTLCQAQGFLIQQ
jgi:hypothetical protein